MDDEAIAGTFLFVRSRIEERADDMKDKAHGGAGYAMPCEQVRLCGEAVELV